MAIYFHETQAISKVGERQYVSNCLFCLYMHMYMNNLVVFRFKPSKGCPNSGILGLIPFGSPIVNHYKYLGPINMLHNNCKMQD